MKSTGIVRKIDELGRLVIPKELRKSLDIGDNAPLEIFTEGDRIVIKKYAPGCIFCSSADGVKSIGDKLVCGDCAKELAARFEQVNQV